LKYFLSFRIFEQVVLALKTEFALKFFTALKYFLSFRIFQQVVLALKTEFALNFSSRGTAALPASYATGHIQTELQIPYISTKWYYLFATCF